MPKLSTFDKLSIKLLEDLNLEAGEFRRTRCGKHQKDAGAFSWTARCLNTNRIIGSQQTAAKLLKMDKLKILEPLSCPDASTIIIDFIES